MYRNIYSLKKNPSLYLNHIYYIPEANNRKPIMPFLFREAYALHNVTLMKIGLLHMY